jgi:hypothetical protein
MFRCKFRTTYANFTLTRDQKCDKHRCMICITHPLIWTFISLSIPAVMDRDNYQLTCRPTVKTFLLTIIMQGMETCTALEFTYCSNAWFTFFYLIGLDVYLFLFISNLLLINFPIIWSYEYIDSAIKASLNKRQIDKWSVYRTGLINLVALRLGFV